MTALALLLCLQSTSFPATPVTLHGPATRLGNLIPMLSEKTKFKLRLSKELANDVVLIDVENLPLNKLSSKLADLCLARWMDTAEGPMLGRDATRAGASEAAGLRLRMTAFQKAQAALREKEANQVAAKPAEVLDALKKHLSSPDAYAAGGFEKTQGFLKQMPMDSAARKIAAIIPTSDVEAIYRDRKVVFALSPNKMQRQMPKAVAAILEQSWGDLQSYGNALRAMTQEDIGTIVSRSNASYLIGFTQGPPPKEGTWWVTGTAYDTSINFNVEYRGAIGALQGSEMVGAFPAPGKGLESDDSTPIELRPESRALVDAYTTADPQNAGSVTMYVQDDKDPNKRYPLHYVYRRMFPVVPDLEAALYKQVLNPEITDPLSYWVSDAILQSARSKKKPFMAWLGDDLFTPSLYAFRQKATVKEFLVNTRIWRGYEWTDAADMLTLRPVAQWDAVLQRGHRGAFGNAIRELDQRDFIRERTLETWAANQSRRPEGQYEDFAIRIVNPMGLDLTQMYRQWTGLGMLGLLSDAQIDLLKQGQSLPYTSFSPDLKARLAQWAFRSSEPLWDMQNWKPDDASSGARFSSLDATFRFPDGVPATANLGLTYRRTPSFLARYPGGKLAEPETALQAASRLWVASKPRESGVVALPSPQSYQEGEERLFRVLFYLDPNWAMSNEFTTFETTGGTYKGFAALPQGHREEVDRLLKIFVKNSGVGSAGGAPPP